MRFVPDRLTLREASQRIEESFPEWACGAAGSALPWHGRGHRFDPDQVHQTTPTNEAYAGNAPLLSEMRCQMRSARSAALTDCAASGGLFLFKPAVPRSFSLIELMVDRTRSGIS